MLNNFAHVADNIDEGVVDHMTDSNHWLGDGGFTVFWMIALMAIVALVVVLVMRSSSDTVTNKDPLDVAKARFAKGEIDKKEFESLKKELNK